MALTIYKRLVTLRGISPIMFDKYPGSNEEQLSWREKVYFSEDKKTLIFPALNLISFLSAQNTQSAPQRVMGKKWRGVAQAVLSYVTITPNEIPILRNDKPILIDKADLREHRCTARVKKGQLAVPNPKSRPVLSLPWEIKFDLMLVESKELTENILRNLFEIGGVTIGLGTYRGLFGKFEVAAWDNR